MDSLDIDGHFWLEGDPTRKVAGRLTFNNVDGVVLNLIGSFHDPQEILTRAHQASTGPEITVTSNEMFGSSENPLRILGETNRGPVTLEGCMRSRANFPLSRPVADARESYQGELALLGVHVLGGDPIVFNAAKLRLGHLEHWVRRSAVGLVYDVDGSKVTGLNRITYTTPEESIVTTDFGELDLTFGGKLRGDHFVETTIEQDCSFGLKFAEPRSLEEVIAICSDLQNLVTIGLDTPSTITYLYLSPCDQSTTQSFGDRQSIELYAEFTGADIHQGKGAPRPTDIFFTFDDIGGLEGIARWLKTSNKFRLVVGSLLGHRYLPSIYTDNRLLNMMIAAETLQRIRLQKQRIDFKKALIDSAAIAGDPFKAIVEDVAAWAKEVRGIRVNQLVHRGLHESPDGQRMYAVSESLYLLVILCLLRECEVSEETLSNPRVRQKFLLVARQLRGHL